MNVQKSSRLILRCATVFITAGFILSTPLWGQDYLCGDGNNDGTFNVGDAVFIINYVFRSGKAPVFSDAADVNCDGAINVGDAVLAVQSAFSVDLPLCSGCSRSRQQFVFEIRRFNFAWGASYGGFYFDIAGNVYSYEYDRDEVPFPIPPFGDPYSPRQLAERYNHNRTLVKTVDMAELLQNVALIAAAGEGPLSPTVHRCYDAGEIEFLGYLYDESEGSYRAILLELTGDYAATNFSREAREIVGWLIETTGWGDLGCSY